MSTESRNAKRDASDTWLGRAIREACADVAREVAAEANKPTPPSTSEGHP